MMDVYSQTLEAERIDRHIHGDVPTQSQKLCKYCLRNEVTEEGIDIDDGDILICENCVPENIANACDVLQDHWLGADVNPLLLNDAAKIMKEISGRI